MPKNLPIMCFVGGLTVLSFCYGVAVGTLKLFPSSLIRHATSAAEALFHTQTASPTDLGMYLFKARSQAGGVTTFSRDKAFHGYTLLTAFDGNRCTNLVIDMEGRRVHEWFIAFSEVWPKAPFLLYQHGDEWTCWQGKHLLPNGDLVATFWGTGFPDGYGTVRLDRQSNIVWALPRNTHHDVHRGPDGRFYLVALRYHQNAGSRPFRIQLPEGADQYWETPVEEDVILIVSDGGEVLDEISVLKSLTDSEYRGMQSVNFRYTLDIQETEDPTHLNNVEVITKEWASYHPGIEPGDLLVSLRNISTLAIIDRQTRLIKWALSGRFIRQHDPDLLPNGNILLYDNWGAPQAVGRTRVMELDPATQQVVWQYAGTVDRPLYSTIRGSQQLLPNGNVLITEPEGGRVLEVTRNQEIVWEYVNLLNEGEEEARVGIVIGAERFSRSELPFLEN